ncbi:MAG: Asp-tRNA(Asn)/Glu-tRNA(Gln) amidotransferase subunit GatB [Limnochordales bacterium]|nr:Asp-tRNA(Asn)/Glu-tRNA(Gln) amidotransferase GatCAB subunit B [Bacillota bacterium]
MSVEAAVKPTTEYEVIIGLEIHAELLTDAKVFCGCSTKFGAEPNTQICPVCLGLPGTLPVLNRKAVEYAIKAGLALNCEIAPMARFDRKHYFYPDLPKAYQITQYAEPLCRHGYVEFELNGETRRVRIRHIHLEEEAGKLQHAGDRLMEAEYSLVDYNRGGIPLIEIVTEPDIRSPEEARVFLETLRSILRYAGVSDCKMEEGSLRCDANISLRPKGSTTFGNKAEVKNLNSFRAVQRALEYEVRRQAELLDRGEQPAAETRHWDEARGVTVAMRSKGEEDDYLYMPEPDIPWLKVDREWVERLRAELPELPRAKMQRFMTQYGLPAYDSGVLTAEPAIADFFEACVAVYNKPKTVSNWIMVEFLRLLREDGREVSEVALTPQGLAELLGLIDKGVISGTIAKEVFEEMFRTGKSAAAIVRERGLEQISDEAQLAAVVDEVIAENEDAAAKVRAGEMKTLGFLVGQVMKKTQGKANPKLVNELLRARLVKE